MTLFQEAAHLGNPNLSYGTQHIYNELKKTK